MRLGRISTRQQLVVITVLGALLRFVGINQSLWHDEWVTLVVVEKSFGQMLSSLARLEASPPVYYALLWVWGHLFGFGVTTSRLLGVLIGIPLAPVMYGIAKGLTKSHQTGMIAAACAAFSPLMVWYSQEVRPYGLLVLLTAITFLAFVHLITEEPTRRWIVIWTIASALALGTHFYAIFTVLPQAVWLLIRYRRRREILAAVNLIALCGLALVPLLTSERSHLAFSYITGTPLSTRLSQIVPQFLLGVSAPSHTVLKFAGYGIVGTGILLLAFRGTRREQRAGGAMALLAAASFALIMLVAAFVTDTVVTRNVLGLWVPLAVAVAIGLGSIRYRLAGTGLTLALSGIGIAIVVAIASTLTLQRADWAGVARLLMSPSQTHPPLQASNPTRGRRLVVVQAWPYFSPLRVYMPHLHDLKLPSAGTAMADVAEIDLVRILKTVPAGTPVCWWGTPCHPSSAPAPDLKRIPGFRVIDERRVQQFFVIRMRPVGRPRDVTVHTLAVALSGLSLAANRYLYEGSW